MSEHTTTTQKPPAASMLDALEEMSTALSLIAAQQAQWQDKWTGLGTLLTDLRDIVRESTELMHEQTQEMGQKVERLTQQAAQPLVPERPWWHWRRPLSWALVLGLLLIAGVGLWKFQGTAPPLDALARDLDSVLVQGYPQLPKGLQDKINTLYSQHQFQAPGKRQQGGK
jgi:hypothetical protein